MYTYFPHNLDNFFKHNSIYYFMYMYVCVCVVYILQELSSFIVYLYFVLCIYDVFCIFVTYVVYICVTKTLCTYYNNKLYVIF